MVPERGIRIKSITEIPFGFRSIIDNGLKIISSAFPDNLPAQETASGSVSIGQEPTWNGSTAKDENGMLEEILQS